MTKRILTFVLCTGCSYNVPADHRLQLYVDQEGFTTGEIADIYSAAIEWQWATGETVKFVITGVDQGSHLVHVKAVKKGDIGKNSGECMIDPTASTIQVRLVPTTQGTSVSNFPKIAKHELGHALGLDHDVMGTVMCEHTGCSNSMVTCRDVEKFCEVWKCDAETLPACGEAHE